MKDFKLFQIGKYRVSFAWYDLWIGYFIDTNKRKKYICILPCLLIQWEYKKKSPNELAIDIIMRVLFTLLIIMMYLIKYKTGK